MIVVHSVGLLILIQGQILDLSSLGALESISRAKLRWFIQRFSSRGRWARSWTQLLPKTGQDQETLKNKFASCSEPT